jgi:hypothetical protein
MEAFLYLKFGFGLFWHNKMGAKVAFIMLLKLTPVVNFINLLGHGENAVAHRVRKKKMLFYIIS